MTLKRNLVEFGDKVHVYPNVFNFFCKIKINASYLVVSMEPYPSHGVHLETLWSPLRISKNF